jgi:transcription elongation factor GreA
MATERFILTRQGYEQLQRELTDIEARRAERLEQLRDYKDDVGENPNEEGAFFEAETMKEHFDERIGHLQLVLQEAEVIDDDPNPHTADPGDRVTVWDVDAREERTFDLIGSAEATYLREGVSIESPVGQALIGKRVGETVEVTTPDGRAQYVIRRLERIPA